MEIGLAIFPTDYTIAPAELGRLAEERGFDCLLFPEHTHIPASRKTPYPVGGDLPPEYFHTHDPFVALAQVAAVTERLLVGTGICLVVERDPIVTAKEAASLNHVSGGRLLFGVGAGWNREEMENHGVDPRRRFSVTREKVEAIKAIWAEDEAEYHGEHVDFDGIWSWPKPAQKPHPPVLVGGVASGALKRVVAYGDEWMPNWGFDDLERFGQRVEKLQRLAREAGRDEIPVTAWGAPRVPDQVKRLEEAGVHRMVWHMPPESPAEVVTRVERYAERAAQIRG